MQNSHGWKLRAGNWEWCGYACRRHSGIYNSLVIPSGFHNLGISNKTSFLYPQTFHSVGISNETSFSYPQTFLSVGISNKTSFSYPQTFHSVGISNETSFSYPQAFHSVGISNETSFSYPQTIHVEAEEGHRLASPGLCSCGHRSYLQWSAPLRWDQ